MQAQSAAARTSAHHNLSRVGTLFKTPSHRFGARSVSKNEIHRFNSNVHVRRPVAWLPYDRGSHKPDPAGLCETFVRSQRTSALHLADLGRRQQSGREPCARRHEIQQPEKSRQRNAQLAVASDRSTRRGRQRRQSSACVPPGCIGLPCGMKAKRKLKGGRFVAWARGAFTQRATVQPCARKPSTNSRSELHTQVPLAERKETNP